MRTYDIDMSVCALLCTLYWAHINLIKVGNTPDTIEDVGLLICVRGGPFDIWGVGGGVEENIEKNKLFPILLKINKLFLFLLKINTVELVQMTTCIYRPSA